MNQIAKIKNIDLSNLSPSKQLRILKIVMFASVILLIITTVASLAITGKFSNILRFKFYDLERYANLGNPKNYGLKS